MADAEKHEIIIVRRYEDEDGHHHGNSTWKVAHADFMTAMMAFFLIMWLINATDEKVKQEIANYFNPIRLADNQPNRKGLNDPEASPQGGAAAPGQKPTKGVRDAGPYPMTLGPLSGEAEQFKTEGAERGDREQAVFQDPYAALAEIAEGTPDASDAVTTADVMVADTKMPGVASGSVVRDPFDPVYWQTTTGGKQPEKGEQPSTEPPKIAAAPPDAAEFDATKALSEAMAETASLSQPAEAEAEDETTEADAAAAAAVTAAAAGAETADDAAKALAARLVAAVQSDANAPNVEVTATGEGLMVSLTDDSDFSMFDVGSAVPRREAVLAIEKIAKILAERQGEIIVRGHTDSRPFRSPDYDNWRLSTARAHMAYYMLVRGGIDEKRFRKIEGFADRDPRDASDPEAAINRRIDILLREPAA